MLYLLDRTALAHTATGHRSDVDEREDSAVAFCFSGRQLAATAFAKGHTLRQSNVVDNKRLGAALQQLRTVRLPAQFGTPWHTSGRLVSTRKCCFYSRYYLFVSDAYSGPEKAGTRLALLVSVR